MRCLAGEMGDCMGGVCGWAVREIQVAGRRANTRLTARAFILQLALLGASILRAVPWVPTV